jgi:ADP-heptose:LPS heptosyltransferase
LNKWNVGIAPFAQHQGKAYSFEKVKTVIEELKKNASINLFLFGGGPAETELLQNLEGENVFSMAGKFSLNEELAQISNLDLMLSMDSANMHMASLFGVRTISVWGATHYFAGFMGVGQQESDAVEISTEDLNCRPCSVFGNKECFRKDYACLNRIKSSTVAHKIIAALND